MTAGDKPILFELMVWCGQTNRRYLHYDQGQKTTTESP